jgi:Ca2+-transporting ATPase
MMPTDKSGVMSGLTAQEVEQSRLEHGENILTPPARESVWRQFLSKFRDPLIVILLVAGFVSILISIYEYVAMGAAGEVFIEPVGIFMAILLATGLGFYFEHAAEKEFEVLNKMSDDQPVQVVRDGNTTSVPRREVVVDDVVMLNTGDEVPADGVLLRSVRLAVDESTLTGEPICQKSADPELRDPDATFPTDEVLRGTKVVEGHGIMKVRAVGDATECGRVYEASRIDNSVKTPLDEQLDRLGRFIAIASYVIGALVIAGRVTMYLTANDGVQDWMSFGLYILQSLMLAVTLVVVSVPEGLPMAVTLSLAYSMRRMLRTSNLVRKMHACETMGAVTVICTDKTGTLTANRMVVDAVDFLDSTSEADAMMAMAVNSTAELDMSDPGNAIPVGNPTEGALLLWINSKGGDYKEIRSAWERQAELPFTTERKYMATVVSDGRSRRLMVKGAPEIVFAMCVPQDGLDAGEFERLVKGYQSRGMRTLGFASCELAPGKNPIQEDGIETDGLKMNFVVAISDPVREDVPDAVKECLDAGIKVKVVTGDTPATACEIARQIGLWSEGDNESETVITGPEVAAMTDEELRRRAPKLKIIARARPMDKKRLVEALQADGEIVAVTGDGTNDAPALKAAHVGLSMGDGTTVAKEASDITILNNSFSGIGNAVMWGRSLYRNIQRFILFQLTVNLAACLTVLVGSFMGTQAPLTVTQMLWVNLVMDTFAAMALASLPPSRSVMSEKPRDRRDFIITASMGRFITIVGGLFGIAMLGLLFVLEHASIGRLTDLLHPVILTYKNLTPYELGLFFSIFVMLQAWNLFNARAFATRQSAFHLRHCGEFLLILAVVFIGQILIVSIGGRFFNVVPISVVDWVIIIAGTSMVLWVGEAIRAFERLRRD